MNLNYNKKTKILITGGSGFIGTNLMDFYIKNNIEVLNIDINKPRNPAHMSFWEKVDINDLNLLNRAFSQFEPDYIVHLAARTDLDGNCIDDYITNTLGVQNVIDSCKDLGNLKRVIFASSKLVCRNGYTPSSYYDYYPDTYYGESKVEGEKRVLAINNYNFSWVIVRPTSIWGPWFDIPYRNFFDTVKKGIYVHPYGVRAKKTYGFSGNIVFQLDRILFQSDNMVSNKIFYLGDYEPIEIKDWADKISIELGVRKPMEVPLFILRFLAKSCDLLEKVGINFVPYSSFRLNNILAESIFDLSELKIICGDTPFGLSEGVKLTVDWLKKNNK